MAKLAPFGRYRAFDNLGKPLDGGKLYTYIAGTSTPKATYTSKDQSAANQNPVTLDANGYADVWLDAGGYKFILRDKAGNLLWTADNIDGGSATGFASSVISKSASFNLGTTEQGDVVVCTASLTVSLLPAATAGDGFAAVIINTSAGNVTIDPDGSETINGQATLIVRAGGSVNIFTDGTAWYADMRIPNAGTVDNTALSTNSVTTSKIADASVTTVKIADSAVTTPKIADASVTTAKLDASGAGAGTYRAAKVTVNAQGRVTAIAAGIQEFVSVGQTISNVGGLTLAHGLPTTPYLIQTYLKCITAELGYSVGDMVLQGQGQFNQPSSGLALVPDATNITIRFGGQSTVMQVLHKTLGTQSYITLANWQLVVMAWTFA